MDLAVIGTVALDTLKTPHGSRDNMLGGSAAHFCMGARHFTDAHLAGVIGEDFPEAHIGFLKKRGVNVDNLTRMKGKTFRWSGEYLKGNPNQAITRLTELGVLLEYKPEISVRHKKARHIFLANCDPDQQHEFLSLFERPRFVGLDSMNLWIDIKRDSLLKLLKRVDLFLVNDGEAKELTGEGNLIRALKKLRSMGPKHIIIKKGEHGVIAFSDRWLFGFPAYPVSDVIDPTGAGDTFAGALMGYLAHKRKISETVFRQALVYATVCASFNVETFGMEKTAHLTKRDLEQRRRQFLKFMKHE